MSEPPINPYESPRAEVPSEPVAAVPLEPDRNRLGEAGFTLVIAGVIGSSLMEVTEGATAFYAAMVLPGLILSGFGLRHRRRKLAAWGVGIGLVTCGYAAFVMMRWLARVAG